MIVITSISCTEQRIKSKITALQSEPIVLKTDSMICLSDRCNLIGNKSLKWIVYHDSSVCKPCQIAHVPDWDKIKENKNIECVFIFSAKAQEVEKYREAFEKNECKGYIYIDTVGVFIHDNPQLPQETSFHNFLIDKENRVLLVGNPITNNQIYELFIKILKDKNHKK